MKRVSSPQTTGFTLLELLVAMAVFAVLALIAYQGLNAVLANRAAIEQHADRLRAVQTAWLIIGRDIQQASPRWVRDELGGELGPLKGGEGFIPLLEFTRAGYRNPAGVQRSTLQRVAYQLKLNELSRWRWRALDRAQDSQPLERVLLAGVRNVALRFLDESREWQSTWPPPNRDSADARLPRAIEVTLELEDWGRITRLFALPG
ncbi:MAG: type II secretion system protein GspJ [Proteobacteria bacterium]|nr:MAG: type II secretion system protein GspJ [Pseudomonadota bacterium]QKK10972.1 MAG: type II secretion system minor pseudopilin GspJ [Pseudomonadota bacterium]